MCFFAVPSDTSRHFEERKYIPLRHRKPSWKHDIKTERIRGDVNIFPNSNLKLTAKTALFVGKQEEVDGTQ
jgi:hypothetical protein